MSWGSLWSQAFGQGDMEEKAVESFSSTPLNTPSNANMLTQLNQQTDSPESAVSMLKEMAKSDPAYNELLVQLLAERENQERAYRWYEDFNNSYFQRTTKDLEKAGLNPWLALQSLGSGGSGSLSPAGTWSGSSGNTLAGQKVRQQMENQAQLGAKGIGAVATILGAIAGALIMALL